MNRWRHEEKGMPSDIKFLTIEDLAEMLQVTRTTIYNLKNKGLPFIKLGRNIRFDQDEVIEWIKNGQEASSQESK
jgi:excisionase family DNA binding protein